MEAIIFIGLQATGKTTFYTQRFFRTHVRISMDMLRTRHREEVIMKACLEAKRELLAGHGINFDRLPSCQKHGMGLHWEQFERPGRNPVTDEDVTAVRRRVCRNLELPTGDTYGEYVERLVRGLEHAGSDLGPCGTS